MIVNESALEEIISRYARTFWCLSILLSNYQNYEEIYEYIQNEAQNTEREGKLDEFKTFALEYAKNGKKSKMN
jgi:hypothetical protein